MLGLILLRTLYPTSMSMIYSFSGEHQYEFERPILSEDSCRLGERLW